MVLIEAAASGRPVITIDHLGCRGAIDLINTGSLVPIHDHKALLGAILKLLNNFGYTPINGSRIV